MSINKPISFDYEIGTVDNSNNFKQYIENCNIREIIKNKYIGKVISLSITASESRIPMIDYEEWVQIAVTSVFQLVERHKEMEWKGGNEGKDRSKQLYDFLKVFLPLEMLDYVDSFKGIDMAGVPTTKYDNKKHNVSEGIEGKCVDNMEYQKMKKEICNHLSQRETEVFKLIYDKDMNNKMISEELNIAVSTVRSYKERISNKCDNLWSIF